jgi:hypothetical protein
MSRTKVLPLTLSPNKRWIPRDYKYTDSQLSGETQEFNQASQAEEKLWVAHLLNQTNEG